MKTTSTQPLQFSGYPLQPAKIAIGEKWPARVDPDEKKIRLPQETKSHAMDAPENWDESWFANYE